MNYSITTIECNNTVIPDYYKLKFEKGFKFQPHYHPRPEIMLIVLGEVTFYIADKTKPNELVKKTLTSGQYIFCDSLTAHGFYCNEDSVILNLEFDYSPHPFKNVQVMPFIQILFSNYPNFMLEVTKKGYIVNFDHFSLQSCMEDIINLIEKIKWQNKNSINELVYLFIVKVQEFFTILCYNTTQLHPTNITHINHANEFLIKNYLQDITSDDVANAVGISKFYLERLYKAHTGKSLWDVLITLRLERAKQLLATTNYSITEIAKKSGFNIRQQLIYNFKKRIGFTPSQYANHHKDIYVDSFATDRIREQTFSYKISLPQIDNLDNK